MFLTRTGFLGDRKVPGVLVVTDTGAFLYTASARGPVETSFTEQQMKDLLVWLQQAADPAERNTRESLLYRALDKAGRF